MLDESNFCARLDEMSNYVTEIFISVFMYDDEFLINYDHTEFSKSVAKSAKSCCHKQQFFLLLGVQLY